MKRLIIINYYYEYSVYWIGPKISPPWKVHAVLEEDFQGNNWCIHSSRNRTYPFWIWFFPPSAIWCAFFSLTKSSSSGLEISAILVKWSMKFTLFLRLKRWGMTFSSTKLSEPVWILTVRPFYPCPFSLSPVLIPSILTNFHKIRPMI